MEVFRHARRRSKYHSLHHEEMVQAARERRGTRGTHASRQPKLHEVEDEDWRQTLRRLADES
jgi:hypothetical protein